MGNFREAAGQLNRIAGDMERAGPRAEALVARIVAKTAADIEADAKQIVPVDTGNLRASISREVSASVFAGVGGSFRAVVGPSANYGAFVEYGTSRQSPQPYMGPAFNRRAPAFLAAMGKVPGLSFRRVL